MGQSSTRVAWPRTRRRALPPPWVRALRALPGLELDVELFHLLGLFEGLAFPLLHLGEGEDAGAVVGGGTAELHVVGAKARAHGRIHRVRDREVIAHEV